MSPPIRDGSGSSIGSIRLGDGTEISEVRTGAGDVLFSANAIPDSRDLQTRYDFTQVSSTSSVSDQTGNGNDLSGSFSGTGVTINDVQAGEFDGVDDEVSGAFSSTVSQPFHFFAVAEITESQSDFTEIVSGDDTTNRAGFVVDDSTLKMFGGQELSATNTQFDAPHILSGLFDGSNSVFRIDGTQVASGNAGSNSLDGITIGSRPSLKRFTPVNVGEVLLYPQDKTSIVSDIESYLADEWGFSI